MPRALSPRIARMSTSISPLARGAVGSSKTTTRAASSIRARAIWTSLRWAVPRSRTRRVPGDLRAERLAEEALRAPPHAPAVEARGPGDLLAHEDRLGHGEVGDEVELLVDEPHPGGVDGRRGDEGRGSWPSTATRPPSGA